MRHNDRGTHKHCDGNTSEKGGGGVPSASLSQWSGSVHDGATLRAPTAAGAHPNISIQSHPNTLPHTVRPAHNGGGRLLRHRPIRSISGAPMHRFAHPSRRKEEREHGGPVMSRVRPIRPHSRARLPTPMYRFAHPPGREGREHGRPGNDVPCRSPHSPPPPPCIASRFPPNGEGREHGGPSYGGRASGNSTNGRGHAW